MCFGEKNNEQKYKKKKRKAEEKAAEIQEKVFRLNQFANKKMLVLLAGVDNFINGKFIEYYQSASFYSRWLTV